MTNEEEVKELFGDDNQLEYVVGSIGIVAMVIGVIALIGYLIIK